MPVVYLSEEQRGAACAEALAAAGLIGEELEVPVILYGELATRPENRERAALREGGSEGVAERIESGELVPDFGPARPHPTAGVTLAAARPPLIAFNVDLASDDLDLAKRIAAEIREAGGGLHGVRAIGLYLDERGRAQVSTNVHDYRATPLREVVNAVRRRADVAEAELVGLAPEAAFNGFPDDVPIRGFSPERHLLENALRTLPDQLESSRSPWPRASPSAAASIAAPRPARSSGPAAPAAPRPARTRSRSRASGAPSGSTSRPRGAAR